MPERRPRLGPRPLGLHLATAAMTWLSSAAALPLLRPSSPPSGLAPTVPRLWHPSLRAKAESLGRDLAGADPEALGPAVQREIRRRLDELERGIRRYHQHPYRRDLSPPPVVWAEGTTQLFDYGAVGRSGAGGPPLLVVPSLINRAYILDLSRRLSLMRTLAAQGFRPFLVDWAHPGPIERNFDLTAYITGRLAVALERTIALAGRPPVVIGYCMGGLLALALAQLRPRDVAGLVLLATPWDFHADKPETARTLVSVTKPWLPLFESMGVMPVDVLQALFAGLDPFQITRKFANFARLDPASDRAEDFVALEDWLNDGVPLAAPVARECLVGWYGENTPARGAWHVAGTAIRPDIIDTPTLVVVPEQDRIVPPASAHALARGLRRAEVLTPALGHIGMVSSRRAPQELWPALAAWLAARLATRNIRSL